MPDCRQRQDYPQLPMITFFFSKMTFILLNPGFGIKVRLFEEDLVEIEFFSRTNESRSRSTPTSSSKPKHLITMQQLRGSVGPELRRSLIVFAGAHSATGAGICLRSVKQLFCKRTEERILLTRFTARFGLIFGQLCLKILRLWGLFSIWCLC